MVNIGTRTTETQRHWENNNESMKIKQIGRILQKSELKPNSRPYKAKQNPK